jgi:hypothetical protein
VPQSILADRRLGQSIANHRRAVKLQNNDKIVSNWMEMISQIGDKYLLLSTKKHLCAISRDKYAKVVASARRKLQINYK